MNKWDAAEERILFFYKNYTNPIELRAAIDQELENVQNAQGDLRVWADTLEAHGWHWPAVEVERVIAEEVEREVGRACARAMGARQIAQAQRRGEWRGNAY